MEDVLLDDVVKRFGDAVALDHVDLKLRAGQLSTLLGPSGCGKTTTLRMIAGLEHPTGGRIAIGKDLVFGEGVLIPAERRGIGMVFQSYAVWPHLTVFENVAYPLRVRRAPKAEVDEKVGLALRTVRMDHLAARYPAQLSGGQQQRVALARSIVYAPRLLLLDEPLSNLDAQLRDEMRVEIRQLQTRLNLTAVYVTHDQAEALAISDFIAVMNRGRVVQQGTPQAIFQKPASRFVAQFMGWTNFLPATRRGPGEASVLDWTQREAGRAGDDPLCAAIRPDHIALDDRGGGDRFHLPAQVTAVTYLGNLCACDLAAGPVQLQARVPAEAAPVPGQSVTLSFEPHRLRLMRDDVVDRG